ncbi:MAG: hypothetical protein DYG98_10505 [Haliscomenobacteraceae bacterium CHB4]|nr:hypothetical protein [Haliscomenobacteraceae bacterium CHB4]
MELSSSEKLNAYLKLIDYKRSIGITQWTIIAIFITASETVLVFSLNMDNEIAGWFGRILGIVIFWLGFVLYNRYRSLNKTVAKFLMELEEENNFKFQHYLQSQFHPKGLSTTSILVTSGVIYMVIALVSAIVKF